MVIQIPIPKIIYEQLPAYLQPFYFPLPYNIYP